MLIHHTRLQLVTQVLQARAMDQNEDRVMELLIEDIKRHDPQCSDPVPAIALVLAFFTKRT